MRSTNNNIIEADPSAGLAHHKPQLMDDYAQILDRYGLSYNHSGFYLEVGQPEWTQGWLIELAAIPVQVEALFETILPLLQRENLYFKVAATAGKARAILGGEYGYLLLGKVVTIYPENDAKAFLIAKDLINLTKAFKGPEILTDRRLGAVVFARYGAVKPIIRINEEGTEQSYIYDKEGHLTEDPFSIPFKIPDGVSWPFGSLALPQAPRIETVLQDKYKPMAILKEDAKGTVKKGLYLEKWWRIKWCVIKEGKLNMIGDSRGRDMTDRLQWQYELHKDLQNIVPLPKIYDLFEENGNTYLIMEYIKGRPLDKIAVAIFKDRLWISLPLSRRLRLLDYALQILDIISRMHEKGYVHRDITPANFLSDRDGRLWMIDMEISYNYIQNKPYPPFRLGTPGYMSPEQANTRTPKVEQDVYAIGALFILLLTGLPAEKFASQNQETLDKQLAFFIPDLAVASILCCCLNENPLDRPTITKLKLVIDDFRNKQKDSLPKPQLRKSDFSQEYDLEQVVNSAFAGLGSSDFLSTDQLWYSMAGSEKQIVYTQDSSKTVYPGFSNGLSGILYFLAKAHRAGFDLGHCCRPYESSVEFIRQNYLHRISEMPRGLYKGTAGIGLALAEGVKSGLILRQKEPLEMIQACFLDKIIQDPSITTGIAGQGMAILQASDIFPPEFLHSILPRKVEYLLELQQKDGSWVVDAEMGKKAVRATGFGRGIAGILCFLLGCIEASQTSPNIEASIERALNWLTRQSSKKHSHVRWYLHSGSSVTSPNFQDGCSGIALCLIKAHQITGIPLYRQLAEDCLRNYEPYPTSVDATLATGLAGLGEVYLEARDCFQSQEWQERADWIASFLLNTYCLQKDGGCYWMPDGSPFSTAGLLEGNSGIMHFLLRYYKAGIFHHPLLIS